MSFAQGASSGLSYMAESTFGVTPGTPAMIALPINTHSLGLRKSTIESEENRSDRQVLHYRHGNKQVGGDIAVDFRADDYDPLLEAVFMSTFATNVLKTGSTRKSFVMEDRATDITQYRLMNGMMVSSLALEVRPDAIVKGSFSLVGKSLAQSGSSIDGTVTAASTNAPFDSFSATIQENGSPIASITSIDFRIENGLSPTFVVGSAVTPFIEYGRSRVSGTVTAYYENSTLLNKFINETESDIELALTDGVTGNTYTFLFPRIKYNAGDVPLQNEQSRTISLPFVGLYDASEATNIKLTKS